MVNDIISHSRRFIIVGSISTFIQYVVMLLLIVVFSISPVASSTIGFVTSAVINYTLSYHYTFRSAVRHRTAVYIFLIVTLVGLALNSGVMKMLVDSQVHYLTAQLSATAVVLVWSFFCNRHWTFRSARRIPKT